MPAAFRASRRRAIGVRGSTSHSRTAKKEATPMFARISYTWELMGSSWSILKKDKAMVLFPLFSGISCLIVIASFIVPLFVVDIPAFHRHGAPTQGEKIAGYAYLFAFYFVNYFVITFFNVGIV